MVRNIKVCQIFQMLVRSCLLITLIKCLKGHKSLGSLCNVKIKSPSVTKLPIELFWTAKNHHISMKIEFKLFWIYLLLCNSEEAPWRNLEKLFVGIKETFSTLEFCRRESVLGYKKICVSICFFTFENIFANLTWEDVFETIQSSLVQFNAGFE